MRVRNSSTGTVVTVNDETGQKMTSAGWESADSSPASRRSTKESSSSAGDEDAPESESSDESKPKRRSRRS